MRVLVAALTAVLTLLVAATALAQNIAVENVSRSGDGHGQQGFEFFISRSDCESSETFSFPFRITDTSGIDQIEVWVTEGSGTDCTLAASRDGTGDGTDCIQITSGTTDVDDMGTIEIPAADIANALTSIDNCIDTYTGDAAHDVTIFFLAISGPVEDVPDENSATFETSVDLVGPSPPSDVVAKDAEEAARLEFTVQDTEDLRGYFVYCDPAIIPTAMGGIGGGGVGGAGGGTGGAGGAAGGAGGGTTTAATAGGTGGAGGGGATAACGSGVLVAGAAPPDRQYRCLPLEGDDPLSATDALSVTGLKNGTVYAMAIAAVDDLGNPGVLSEVVCASPREVDDFFDVYRAAGGSGGGGLCSVQPYGIGLGGAFGFGAIVAGAALGLAARRRRMAPAGAKRAGMLTVAGLLVLTPAVVRAQGRIPDTNWRQENRYPDEPADVQFAVEVRFGPYWPAVDSEPGLTGTPYEDTFGTDPNFYFGLEFDYMPLRIPYVGTFGPGIGWGYTWASNEARFTGCTPRDSDACQSEDVTSLTIMPMHLSAVLRADELMRRTGVPIVPYGKFGFGLAVWSAAQTAGLSVSDEQQNGKTVQVEGEDVSWGLHAALGAAFALNWLDAQSAGRLRENTGIGHVYLFGEWMNAILTGLGTGDNMYVGTSTVVVGLSADF